MSAGSPSGKELAATTPAISVQDDTVAIVIAVYLGLEAAHVDATALLSVAFRLFDFADEA